jgi:hypothetical protein
MEGVEAEEVDWKDTLYVWRGLLRDGFWKGTWVPSSTLDVPHLPLFDMSFGFTASRATKLSGKVSGEWNGSYAQAVDEAVDSSGVRWYPEGPYVLREVEENTIVGKGKNEFGPFLMHGTLEENVLTISRRYVDILDERARLGIGELMTWSREDLLDKKHRPAKKRRT